MSSKGEYEILSFASVASNDPDAEPPVLRIERDRIVLGGADVGGSEYCLSKVLARKPGSLHAEVVNRSFYVASRRPTLADEDSDESETSPLFDLRLDRGSKQTRLRLAPLSDPLSAMTLDLQRKE